MHESMRRAPAEGHGDMSRSSGGGGPHIARHGLPRRLGAVSLLTRVFLANAAVLLAITLLLLFSPVEISYPVTETQSIILVTGFIVSLAVNLVLLRGVIAPLHRLTDTMKAVDPQEP